jgi:predicted nucleic acid-binding protein
MAPKVFIDTNIIIDFLDQRNFDLSSTNQLFTLVEENNIYGFISESVITNTINITGFEERILRLLNIIDVICIETNIIKNAMKSGFKDKEDGILYYGALEKNADYFITRNKKEFIKYSLKQLPVLTPKELMVILNVE